MPPFPRYAKLRTPNWLWGGDPRSLLTNARLHSRPEDEGVWSVQTEESYYRRPPSLFRHLEIHRPGSNPAEFGRLQQIFSADRVTATRESIERVNKFGDRLVESADLASVVTHLQVSLAVAPSAQLPEIARHIHEALTAIPMEGDDAQLPFRDAGVHVVAHDPALVHRIKFASVWLRLEYDHRLRSGNVDHIAEIEGGAPAFASASDLHDGMLLFDAYMAPLLGALSPFVWAFGAARPSGNVIVSLGTRIGGASGEAAELLQTLATQGGLTSSSAPPIDHDSSHAAINWWTSSLNQLFGILTDFSVFVDPDGFYNPASHLHGLLSVEQLFRRILSIQASHRDAHARRVLAFSVLDTLQRLTGRPIEKSCSLVFAEKTLRNVRSRLPDSVAEVLLPRATAGVQALRTMQSGFFLLDGKTGVPVPDTSRSDGIRRLGLDDAVAHYVKVLRDATHGHGTNREAAVGKTNALLAHHTGEVPHDLGWLGWLYLLDLLTRPEVLRRTMQSRSHNSSDRGFA